jgi:DNA-binding HxlR family transcriptional regulator
MSFETLYAILRNGAVKAVFEKILKSRIVTEKDLYTQLDTLNEKDLSRSLKELEKAGLIASKEAAVPDWNRYFLTAEGLAAERMLK